MIGNGKRRKHDEQVSDPSKDQRLSREAIVKRSLRDSLRKKHNAGLREVDGVIIHFIGGSSCKIDRMSVDQMVDFIEHQAEISRTVGEDGPNLIKIGGGPFFQLKNVTFVEPWKHTEMVTDMEEKNEK